MSQDRGGGGSITGDIFGLGGYFFDQLGAEVLKRVVKLNLASDGDTVIGNRGGTPLLVEDNVATLRAQRDLDGISELVDTALERATSMLIKFQNLCHGDLSVVLP